MIPTTISEVHILLALFGFYSKLLAGADKLVNIRQATNNFQTGVYRFLFDSPQIFIEQAVPNNHYHCHLQLICLIISLRRCRLSFRVSFDNLLEQMMAIGQRLIR